MESALIGTTASDSKGTSSSSHQNVGNVRETLSIQKQQEMSMPSVDVNIPTFLTDDEKVQPTSIEEQQVPSYQVPSQFTEQSKPVQQLQGTRMDEVLNRPTSHHLLNSPKITAQLRRQMNEGRRLIPIQKTVEIELRPMNITRNLVTVEQNPSNLMDQIGSLSTSLVATQQQYFPTNQNIFKEDLLRKSAESNKYEQPPNSRTICMSTSSVGQNLIIPYSPTQHDSQQQPQKQKIRYRISIKPKNNKQGTDLQGVTKKVNVSFILTKLLNSIRQSITLNQNLLNEQHLQKNHSEDALVNENHLSEIDNTSQTDERMEEETSSANHGANSDSDTITDHEVFSNHKIYADKVPMDRTNPFDGIGIISESNSTNYQNAVEELNSEQNFAITSSSSSDRTTESSQFPIEEHIKISATAGSSNTNRHSENVANDLRKKKKKILHFVLPSEYDPHDTKWTLKYRTNLPGLVQLIPQTGVYVSPVDLKYIQLDSKDCKSLALRLLSEVFNRKALSVCLSMYERAQLSSYNVGPNIRPELDVDACSVLLNFVLEHGLQRGWNTDLQPILSTLHSKTLEIRFKYGVMVEC